MFRTIFKRIFWTNTAIIFFVVVTVSISMFGLLNKYMLHEKENSARKASQSIEYLTIQLALDRFNAENQMIYNATLASWSRMIEADITVVNQDGITFAATKKQNSVPDAYIEKVLSGETVKNNVTPIKTYLIGIPINYGDTTVGGIFYFYPKGTMRSTIREFSFMIFWSLIMGMLISMCLIYFESRQFSKQLKKINSAVLEIASGKFDKRVDVTSYDEISQLASSFNYMANELEHLDKMRTSFISDISHELRTPMTSISGFVQGIIDGTIPKEKQKEYLELVLEESTRLSKLTNDMFEMSKISSTGYKLSVGEFDITEVIRRCIISAGQEIEEKELEMDVWFEHDSIRVLADPDAIKRVIINLLDNAIKFSNKGNTVGIKAYERQKRIYVEISNVGIGIEKEDLPHIFDRFYKTDKSRGKDKTGAGLGLSFVNNIINLHSQKITAESVDVGNNEMKTTFTFTLERA